MTASLLRRFLLLLSLLLLAGHAFATAQTPDLILVDGKTERLYTNPLAPYLEKHPKALPQSNLVSSSNWRGYIATWAVEDGLLLLRKLEQRQFEDDQDQIVVRDLLQQVFPDQPRVVADWYSGTLVLPRGKLVNYVHMGYGSTYSDYRLFVVRNGRVLRDLQLDAAAFIAYRKARFEAFRRTEEFRQELAKLAAKDDYDEKMALDFLFDYYAERYLSLEDALP